MAVGLAAAAGAFALAYPVISQIVNEVNTEKIAKMRKRLDQILAKYNVKISDLQKQIEARGIRMNQLTDKLSNTSPSGRANKIYNNAAKEYYSRNLKDIDTIKDLTHQSQQYSAQEEAKINSLSNSGGIGAIKTILGGNK